MEKSKILYSIADFNKLPIESFTDHQKECFEDFLTKLAQFPLFNVENQFKEIGKVIASIRRLLHIIEVSSSGLSSDSGINIGFSILADTIKIFLANLQNVELQIIEGVRADEAELKYDIRHKTSSFSDTGLLFEKWTKLGYPNKILMHNEMLDILDIPTVVFRYRIVKYFAALRATFRGILKLMCSKLDIILPEQLAFNL